MSRTSEIEDYLKNNSNIKRYVILDDDEIKGELSSHWVKCFFKDGLTRKLAEQAINILKGELND